MRLRDSYCVLQCRDVEFIRIDCFYLTHARTVAHTYTNTHNIKMVNILKSSTLVLEPSYRSRSPSTSRGGGFDRLPGLRLGSCRPGTLATAASRTRGSRCLRSVGAPLACSSPARQEVTHPWMDDECSAISARRRIDEKCERDRVTIRVQGRPQSRECVMRIRLRQPSLMF